MSKFVLPDSSKLVIGTAQLGMNYGIANTIGKQDMESAHKILKAAYESGARFLDTAQQYGNSEQIIGAYMRNNRNHSFRVISKLHPDIDPSGSSAVIEAIKRSYSTIGKVLAGMLMHNPAWLMSWNNGIGSAIRECIEKQYIKAYGVSVYSPNELEQAISIDSMSIFQIPLNVLDRRFLKSGLIPMALTQGKTFFIRSVFLQGLLVMPIEKAVQKIPQSKPYLERWHSFCRKLDMEPGAVALQYVSSAIPEGYIIVGCERPEQVITNRNWLSGTLPESAIQEINSWPIPPSEVINPVQWTKE
ncbi:MAG: aldo/keto reductase [Clostridiales bacterium]|nr:aldo/keto reductase [Clostridiales bacterium]